MELTKLQSELLGLIRKFIAEHGHSPSFKELAELKEVTTTAVFDMLVLMKKKGAVDWKDGQARTLHIIDKG